MQTAPQGAIVGIDIYNGTDRLPDQNSLEFDSVPVGWHHRPQPKPIPQLGTYHVQRFDLEATIEPTELRNNQRQPVNVIFTDGYSQRNSRYRCFCPSQHAIAALAGSKSTARWTTGRRTTPFKMVRS